MKKKSKVRRKKTGSPIVDAPKSSFAKYQGIGNPGMPSGRWAILRYLREMRGH